MKPQKPYRLRRWRLGNGPDARYFFTCARPGRTSANASKYARVPDATVHRWVLGLPSPSTVIISLLGSKPGGLSEFSFYSFYGGFDLRAENVGRLSFQQWLEREHGDRPILLLEHPTHDFATVPTGTLENVASDIRRMLSIGRTVVLVDSGGEQRTGAVCQHMLAVEDSSQTHYTWQI